MKLHATSRPPVIIFLSLLFLLVLSGCSAVKTSILHLTGTISDEEYIQRIDAETLDQNDVSVPAEPEDEPTALPPEGSIHVTFAQNAYMDVQYYWDANFTDPIDLKRCYLMPGDCIYAPEPDCTHPSCQWYQFDRFSICACDESGKRTAELAWSDDTDSSLVLRVPLDQTINEISVLPLGKYEKRTLELSDYYTDSTGSHQELPGTWIVNDTEVSTGRIEISPVESLSIDYQYDDTKYDYVASSPSSFYHEKGLVRFEVTSANQDIAQYSVELRSLEGLFLFDPSQYHIKHGMVSFEWPKGKTLTGPTYIPDGKIIYYTAIPDANYTHPTGSGEIPVNAFDPDETNKEIKDATIFYLDNWVSVLLPRPDGGTVEYTDMTKGEILTGTEATLRCATVIGIKFTPWSGWICNVLGNQAYTVTDRDGQLVSLDQLDINYEVFTEAESHKPTLSLVLDESMKDAKFAVSTSDLSKSDLSYETGSKTSIIPDLLGQNDRELLDGNKVGTGSAITLTVTDDTVFTGHAMKLEIITKDTRKNERRSTRYITELPAQESITLYNERQRINSPTVYESVTIRASKVEVSTYRTTSHPHASVSVKLVDEETPHILRNGDVLESSRDIEVTITPDDGYYIAGSALNAGVYSERMKYSKWEKESAKILDEHPAQKILYVTLDTSDSYGTCVYRLDNTVVTSTTAVELRQGQKLTLEYTLTSPDYQISRNGIGGFFSGITNSNTESISIAVSEALDGQTVRRSDYITVEQKEG